MPHSLEWRFQSAKVIGSTYGVVHHGDMADSVLSWVSKDFVTCHFRIDA